MFKIHRNRPVVKIESFIKNVFNHHIMDTIQLRGHHIRELVRYYDTVLKALRGEVDPQNLEFNRFVYTDQFSKRVGRIFSKIAFENIPVEIVDGLDAICLSGCPYLPTNRETLCLSEDLARQDKEELQKYGLEVGKIYMSQDLMDKIHRVNGTRQVDLYGNRSKTLSTN